MTNLQLRSLSAILLAAFALTVTWVGGAAFRILCAVVVLAIFFEWSRMARASASGPRGDSPLRWVADLFAVLFALALAAGLATAGLALLAAAGTTVLGVSSRLRGEPQWDAGGFLYASLSGLSLAALRGSSAEGLLAILFLFCVVWATDIFAYFVGRSIGGPKLAPAISPGKTRSGALGGVVFAIAAAVAFGFVSGSPHLVALALVAILLSVVSQAGDLFESWVKRRHGAKDSGRVIPGHGGVMDRVDGLVAAAFALFLISVIAKASQPSGGLFPA